MERIRFLGKVQDAGESVGKNVFGGGGDWVFHFLRLGLRGNAAYLKDMQRWMLYAGLAVIGLLLLAGGGYYGFHQYRMGKSAPRWVPLPLRYGVPMEEQKELARQLEEKLRNDEFLKTVVVDAKLKEGFEVESEEAALEELKRRMFVKVGTFQMPTGSGTVPSVNIGVEGTRREKEVLDAASTCLIREAWRLMGIDPNTGRSSQSSAPLLPPSDF